MSNSTIFPLFSTPVYKTEILFNEKEQYFLKNKLDKINYLKYDSDNGYSTKQKNILNISSLFNIKRQINDHVNKYVFETLCLNKIDLYITSSWINLHQKGNYAQPHIHQNSIFSGVLYLEVPNENCGQITFHFPFQLPTFTSNTIYPGVKNRNIYNSHSWSFNPKSGDLLIFPSHLMHDVGINQSDQNRYSLSFNYFARGKISGEKTKELYI